ncbi:hypothetical protein [Streptomyces sp. NBC_01451]|uniref:hypothetical protein n=1 Tax=Streptomyces sp. NBC_01451 TaxID=2903872 RepID=UPI002E37B0ED|nr:hypothetical protein [Streptomyces sp. NBC_01451]
MRITPENPLDAPETLDAPEAPEDGQAPEPAPQPVRELVLLAGLNQTDIAHVHREVLRVLRSGIDTAHVDAYSDDAWPRETLPSYERLLALGRDALAAGRRSRRDDPGMAIDVDVRDDEQFGLLLTLAPYTINAEACQGDRPVFSANDSGTSLWLAVTREQEAELRGRLRELGIPADVLADAQRRRRRWWSGGRPR